MAIDVRKLSNGSGSVRCVYQHGHFCVRVFHRLMSYPGYTLFLLFIIYLQIMDIILYFKICSRGSLDFTLSNKILNQTNNQKLTHTIHIFDPLPIKKIMVQPIIHYIRSPLAESIQTKLHFTYYFPFLSANFISLFHCFLSLVSIKFLSSESLCRRQLGVIIFQVRTFLDCLDGVIYRAQTNNKRFKSYYGYFGYYVDAISDILGGTCLMIGCLFYFYKQRPFRRKLSIPTRSNRCLSSSASDGGSDEIDLIILNIDDGQSFSNIHSSLSKKNDTNSNTLETKQTIFITLALFALRYSLSAMFWDRNVHAYEDLLDSPVHLLKQKALQSSILHSPLTILIFYLWRYLCALSIQDYLLFAIFIDRTWFINSHNLSSLLSEIIMSQTCKYCSSTVFKKSICTRCELNIRSIATELSAGTNSINLVQPPAININGPSINVSGPTTTVNGPVTTVSGPTTTVNGPATTVSGPTTTVNGPATTVSPSIINNPSISSNPSLNKNLPYNHFRIPKNPSQERSSHVILNMGEETSASSQSSVVIKDGITFKVVHILEIQVLLASFMSCIILDLHFLQREKYAFVELGMSYNSSTSESDSG
ncbi:unnamed protein product [Rotaria sp. Silwood2]|nr:unnamed protein product [Rotaria sp. Silwood2]